jgi:hypothetical protein
MAYVAINETLKTQVAHMIDAMQISEIKATFGENLYAWPTMNLLPNDPLFDKFWEDGPQFRGQLPEKWLTKVTQADVHVRIEGDMCVQNRYNISGKLLVPPHVPSYAPDIDAPESDTRFAEVRMRLIQVNEVYKRWKSVKEQVIDFLSECKSLNEAVKLYPDIVHYVPATVLSKLNEQKVRAAKDVSAAAAKLAEMDTTALSAAPVLARITGHK